MENLRQQISFLAEQHHLTLKSVESYLNSILFSRNNHNNKNVCYPFGSFVNGTYTGQSDIDVYIFNPSTSIRSSNSKALNLVDHLKKNHRIYDAYAINNIVFFTYRGVKINAVIHMMDKIRGAKARDSSILNLTRSYPLYLEVVRFLKLFASTYLERYPLGPSAGSKPIYPGSHFYTVVSAVALGIVDSGKPKLKMQDLTYIDAIKLVSNFIGEGTYMSHTTKLAEYEIDPSRKFNSSKDREYFNRCFRALVVHLEKDVMLPGMSVHAVSGPKPTDLLLALAKDNELLRDQKMKEIEMEKEKEKERQLVLQLRSISLSKTTRYDDSDDDYYDYYDNDSDSDGGFYGSNGKRYLDYSEWYESDSFDEDWHD